MRSAPIVNDLLDHGRGIELKSHTWRASMYPDIFFTEEYGKLFEPTSFGGELRHFEHAGISYRFYVRPIVGTSYSDIVSPYGYSGPVVVGEYADWGDFLSAFDDYCRCNKIIAEFARLHPWEKQWVARMPSSDDCILSIAEVGEVAYVDLTQTEDEIWHNFDKGCKSSTKKAEKELKVECDSAIGDFPIWYHQAMDRVGASNDYYFTAPFWEKLDAMTPRVYDCGLAMALFFFYGDYATYFLSASDKSQPGAINLIIWTAIKEAKARNCKIFNLGGGVHEGDSLSSFKRSFTNTTKPFFTYRKIHDQKVYDELCQAKGIDPKSEGFFPAYRRPA